MQPGGVEATAREGQGRDSQISDLRALSEVARAVTELPRRNCQCILFERDTLRYTGRGKYGFQMHYRQRKCKRKALETSKYCWQHTKGK